MSGFNQRKDTSVSLRLSNINRKKPHCSRCGFFPIERAGQKKCQRDDSEVTTSLEAAIVEKVAEMCYSLKQIR
jgi:hypothetical protein